MLSEVKRTVLECGQFVTKWETIGMYDTLKQFKGNNAEQVRNNFNNSLLPGNCNSHVGNKYRVSDCKIVNQVTGKIISSFIAPIFEVI